MTRCPSRRAAARAIRGAAALLALAAAPAAAQESGAIPTPSEFHGFDVGTRYIVTDAVTAYYRMLGERSARADYSEYGRSIQGRPLPMLVVGSERNVARADEIRRRTHALGQVTGPVSAAELARLTEDLPATVWLFIVDTDEEAGVNVLQEVAHDLITRDDAEARALRDSVVVVLTPLTNPDSHARYVTWHGLYDVPGAAVDPNAVENDAHWGMNTDGNALGIDVNRDFGVFVTPEMQALARAATAWRPQFWLDIHSGPNVIFMPPFPRPFHPLWPDQAPKWWNVFARQASANFGAKGWTFNSREGYEGVTSPNFGLSWGMLGPAMNGMLFETFGGRPGKTTAFVRDDGTVATMRMAMDHHAEGIWSLLQVARDHRAEILRDAQAVVAEAVADARAGDERTVILPASGPGIDPDKTERLVERLVLQGVEVRRVDEAFSARARDYLSTDGARDERFPAGTYVVDLVQPNARLARALLDPTLDYSDPQVELPYGQKMPYYDSSWGNLPLVFGVRAYASSLAPPAGAQLVPDRPMDRTARAQHRGLSRTEPAYAYVLPAGRESSYRTVVALMNEGFRVRVFSAPFRIGETTYPKGTFALIRQRNGDALPERIRALGQQHGATVVEVGGPFTDAGVTFGDEARLPAVPAPLVAVVADWPVAQDHIFGGIRTTLQTDFGFPFTPVMMETVNRADLSKYTAVVLPHAGMDVRGGPGFEAGYRGLLQIENLRRYVQGGGTVVAMKGAGELLAADEVLGRGVDFEGYAEHTNGAILRAEWMAAPILPDSETTTWRPGLAEVGMPLLGAGFERTEFAAPGLYPVRLTVRPDAGARVVARYTPDVRRLVMDGYVLESDKPVVAGSPFAVVQTVGRGRVIYLADDITFRGQWYGLNQLFMNALVLGPLL